MSHAMILAHVEVLRRIWSLEEIPDARAFAKSLGPMHAQERSILARWPEGMPYPPLPTLDDEKNMLLGIYDPRWWVPGSRSTLASQIRFPLHGT